MPFKKVEVGRLVSIAAIMLPEMLIMKQLCSIWA